MERLNFDGKNYALVWEEGNVVRLGGVYGFTPSKRLTCALINYGDMRPVATGTAMKQPDSPDSFVEGMGVAFERMLQQVPASWRHRLREAFLAATRKGIPTSIYWVNPSADKRALKTSAEELKAREAAKRARVLADQKRSRRAHAIASIDAALKACPDEDVCSFCADLRKRKAELQKGVS